MGNDWPEWRLKAMRVGSPFPSMQGFGKAKGLTRLRIVCRHLDSRLNAYWQKLSIG